MSYNRTEGEQKPKSLWRGSSPDLQQFAGKDSMSDRALLNRLKRLERDTDVLLTEVSRSSPDCICFPESEPPELYYPVERDVASSVKCPLHGHRFRDPPFHVYASKWLIALRDQRLTGHSAQYQRAWAASFPPDRLAAVEEEWQEIRRP